MSPKATIVKGKIVALCSLTYNTSGVEGRAGVLRWGLGRLTNKSITYMDLHKPNNKLVSV